MIYEYKSKKFIIEENDSAYVSPYSVFFVDNFEKIMPNARKICDFGAGTGVVGIVASSYSVERIYSIEPQTKAFDLLIKNVKKNHLEQLFQYAHRETECSDLFDTIVCNPASLPNITNVNSFCDGGELGLDMINEVIEFSQNHLTKNGKLFIIITGILPVSLIKKKIFSCDMEYRIISKKTIEFREHYSAIKNWVDDMKRIYSEMRYISSAGKLYEELFLFEIRRKD